MDQICVESTTSKSAARGSTAGCWNTRLTWTSPWLGWWSATVASRSIKCAFHASQISSFDA